MINSARRSHLQTVIDGQESRRALDKMSTLHRSRLDTIFCTRRSGSSQLASDETLSRTACPGTELCCKPTWSVDQMCEMCSSPTVRSSTHCSDDVRVDTVIGISTGDSETNVTPERQRLDSESGEGHDCRNRRTEASKEEGSTTTNDRVQHRGAASSASGTPLHREISTPPTPRVSSITRRWRLLVVSILQTERIGGKIL